jgi:hypothetical protein
MKFLKFFLMFLLYLLISFSFSYCFEEIESLHKRINFSKQVSKISNNTIKLYASQSDGLSCLTNDFLQEYQKLMKIPKKYTLCSSYLFPFKFEILKFLMNIPDIKERIGKDQNVTIYLLTYYLLYYMYAPKAQIKNYIIQKKLAQYYNYEDIDDSLKEYFPEMIPGSGLLDLEHYNLLSNLGYNLRYDLELEEVFKKVNEKVLQLPYKDLIYPWTSNYEQFKWAYSMVMSRSFTIKFKDYLRLEGLEDNTNLNLDISTKKNYEINKIISPPNVGATCLIAFVDLINHYQPKYLDYRDKKMIFLVFEKDNFVYFAPKNLNPGQEILHTYSDKPSNILLFLNYGFVIPNNIFNIHTIKVEDSTKLNLSQLGLCKELKCFEFDENDPWKIPETRFYNAKLSQIELSLLNYGRVLFLNKNFDKKTVLKTLSIDKIISFENEVMAWIYYFISFKKNTNNGLLENSLKQCQKYRNVVKNIEDNWLNEKTKRDEWRRNKIYENIYLLDISYKKIVTRQMLGSINQVILNTHKELENLKEKYFLF